MDYFINLVLDELGCIQACVTTDTYMAYAMYKDFIGDIERLSIDDKKAAFSLLSEITKGYKIDVFYHQFVLDW